MDIIKPVTNKRPRPTVEPKKSDTNFLSRNKYKLLICITLLSIIFGIWGIFGFSIESMYVKNDTYQAVDISIGGNNGDQVYFGKITRLTNKVLVLDKVFYIPSSNTKSGLQLQPIVCQIDKPYNRMIFSRSSVNWYENLQPDGQVVQAINNYEKTNTNTPTCSTIQQQTNSNTNTSTDPTQIKQ